MYSRDSGRDGRHTIDSSNTRDSSRNNGRDCMYILAPRHPGWYSANFMLVANFIIVII